MSRPFKTAELPDPGPAGARQPAQPRRALRAFPFLCAGAVLFASPALRGEENLQRELLIFGSAEVARSGDYFGSASKADGLLGTADILLSLQYRRFRLFGEYLLTTRERDLERFQFDWEPSANSIVWIGRYHQLASAWNHEHHHANSDLDSGPQARPWVLRVLWKE